MARIMSIEHETLYREYFTPLFRYIFFRTRDGELASDLTQTIFLKFMTSGNIPNNELHAKRILFTIARNSLIDHWRSKKNIHDSLDEIGDVPANEPNPEQNAITNEDIEFVKNILADFTDTEQEIISMRFAGNMDYKIISETLSITADNARQIYSRAIGKIESIIRKSNNF